MSGHLIAKHVELMKIAERIARAYHANWPDSLRHAILDAEDFLKPKPQEELLTADEEAEALSYMDEKCPDCEGPMGAISHACPMVENHPQPEICKRDDGCGETPCICRNP